jgi:phytanoyl-CoA hydroxylase
MNNNLTRDQIVFYRENGFLLIKDFLDPSELEAWRSAVAEATAARTTRLPDRPDPATNTEYVDNVFTQRLNLWLTNDKMKRIMLDERLGRMAAELAGVDGIRIWHDQALIKEPWANPTAWHIDNPKWSFHSRDSISIWVALDDVTLQNGCMYLLPGTHKEASFDNIHTAASMRDLFKVYPQWAEREPFAAEMPAGSCTFHNGLCAHAAGPNMTPRRRRAMTCAYMPVGSTFNGRQNILTAEQLAKLKVGDELADDERNPVIYSKGKRGQVHL